MKKIFLLIVMVLTVLQMFGQNCACISLATGELKFPNTSAGTIILPNGTLNIPYSITNSNQVLLISVAPHSDNTLNTGIWATQIEIKVNGNNVITGILPNQNPYPHMAGSLSSARTIPFSSLNVGTNSVCVYARCGGGVCLTQCYNINVKGVPAQGSANITLTKECCTETVSSYNGHNQVTRFTGEVRFKMTGTASNAYIGIVNAGNNSMVGFVNNQYTPCYKLPVTGTIYDSNTNAPLTSSATVNGNPYVASGTGYHFKYAGSRFSNFNVDCQNAVGSASQNTNVIRNAFVIPCPCTLPKTCVNGACQ